MNKPFVNIPPAGPSYTQREKIKRAIYCEMRILECLQQELDKPITIWDIDEQTLQRKNLIDMLVNFDLYLDLPDRDLQELFRANEHDKSKNPTLIKLIKRKANRSAPIKGKGKYISIRQLTKEASRDQLNSIYLTTEPIEFCKEISTKFGVHIVRFDENKNWFKPFNWLNSQILDRKFKKFSIEKGRPWGALQTIQSSSNSLIVVDGYITCNKETIDNNLYPILDELLPKYSLDIPYNVTIITNQKGADINKNFEIENIEEAKQIVSGIIKKLRGESFLFDVNTCNMKGTEHDRYIITNYVYITCSSGFDVLDKNKRYSKSSVVHASFIHSNQSDYRQYEALCQRLIALKSRQDDWKEHNNNRLL